MDKKIANNVIVGIFVLLAICAFVFILFSVANGKGFLSRSYHIFAKFQHVKGLHYGSEVSLEGLSIGVVKGITISPDSNELVVELALEQRFRERVHEDSIASIRTQGILGDKYIEITLGSPAAPPMMEGSYIRTDEPKDILSKGNDLVDDISKKIKQGDLDSLLRNLNRVAANLAEFTSDMRGDKYSLLNEALHGKSGQNVAQASENLNKASSHLADVMRKINNGEGSLGALINDPSVYEDLKSMMGGAKRSAVLKYFMRQFIESGEKAEKQSKASGK
jgi:phospholipid/cholesterol/gamma-HCH transport system substrate-binding protein